MNDEIKKLRQAVDETELAAAKARGDLREAINEEAARTIPVGMKLVGFEVEYDQDEVEVFWGAVPVDFVVPEGRAIRGYKYRSCPGTFNGTAPEGMLVFNEDKYSLTWLQWLPWKEVFGDFVED